jgi:hypothetical protein
MSGCHHHFLAHLPTLNPWLTWTWFNHKPWRHLPIYLYPKVPEAWLRQLIPLTNEPIWTISMVLYAYQ